MSSFQPLSLEEFGKLSISEMRAHSRINTLRILVEHPLPSSRYSGPREISFEGQRFSESRAKEVLAELVAKGFRSPVKG